jgi:hypothetical protein
LNPKILKSKAVRRLFFALVAVIVILVACYPETRIWNIPSALLTDIHRAVSRASGDGGDSPQPVTAVESAAQEEPQPRKIALLPPPYAQAPGQPTRELLQFGVKYQGRFTENDHPAFMAPWPATPPKVDCEDKPDCAPQEAEQPETPRRGFGDGSSCTKGLATTGFRQYKRTRGFALPSVESGDVLLVSARYFSGLLAQKFSIAVSDEAGTAIASTFSHVDEHVSLAAKVQHAGPHYLSLYIDGCAVEGEERYELQVVRRGEKAADAGSPVLPHPDSKLGRIVAEKSYEVQMPWPDDAQSLSPTMRFHDARYIFDYHVGGLVKGKSYVLEATSADVLPYVLLFGHSETSDMDMLWYAGEASEGENVMHKFELEESGPHVVRIVATGKRMQGLPGEQFDRPLRFQFRISALPE